MIAALAGALLLALLPVPTLDGPVVDRAGVLSQPERARLDALARAAHDAGGQGKGPQLAFLIVPSLEGEPIETYSIRVAEKWKLGARDRDDGLLFIVSIEDRVARIEVGGGLEGDLTDVQAGRIVREIMAPAFGQGGFGAGLRAGAEASLNALGVDVGQPKAPRQDEAPIHPLLLLAVVAILFFGARALGIPIRLGGTGSFGGSGGGRRGGGGGGYRGGGGGFSGGGASGRW
ncbi:MAG TPA: TPM domain-containing protein [Vulgatibacter sp.]